MKYAKILPISLIFCPYLVFLMPLLIYLFPDSGILITWYMRIYAMVILFVYIGNIILASILKGKTTSTELATWNIRVKLAHIPFYLVGFILGFAVMVYAVVVVFLELILMLVTSTYGISALVRARNEGKISKVFAWLNGICHLFFVLDVVSAVIVYQRLKAARA